MRPLVVVKRDPVGNDAIGVQDSFKAVPVNALLLHRSDHTLHHSVLLRAMRRNEFLFKPVAFDDCGEVPTGKNQTIIRAKKEFLIDATKCSKAADQSMF